jgi:hypothetical protein
MLLLPHAYLSSTHRRLLPGQSSKLSGRDGKPTVVLMRRFAQKQGIRVSGTRQEVLATLLDAIETALPSRRWLDIGEKAEQKSESEDAETGSETSSESEESDPEEWDDVRVIYSMS